MHSGVRCTDRFIKPSTSPRNWISSPLTPFSFSGFALPSDTEGLASMKSDKRPTKAIVFDAYGTLFDVRSVAGAINHEFPGLGSAVSDEWRGKQLEYTWLRSSMGRYEDFWKVTESALVFTCHDMKLPCDAATRAQLMESYLHLDLFPEVKEALKLLCRRPLVILSNGTLRMLRAVVKNA